MADGLIIQTPSSISYTGAGTASITDDGAVEFSGLLTELNIDGVFSSAYKNYMLVMSYGVSNGNATMNAKMRTSSALSNIYWNQYLYSQGTTTAAGREQAITRFLIGFESTGDGKALSVVYFSDMCVSGRKPHWLAKYSRNTPGIYEFAGLVDYTTGNIQGIQLGPSGNVTGKVAIYAFNE